jgi:oxygen-dependent protoporphyrinogen oxidase
MPLPDSERDTRDASARRIIVLGGGLAGLAAAEAAVERLPDAQVTIVEPTGRVGGVLQTVVTDGWLVERSADSFLGARPEAVDLVDRIGLSGELIDIEPRVRRALVWHRGRTVPAPAGFRLLAPGRIAGILGTPLLSPAGRLRVLAERLVPARRPPRGGDCVSSDESLESFAVRRLGREAFERLVQPLASGIWTADPTRLSMAAACPEFLEMERTYGSLWAGECRRLKGRATAAAAGARYGQFLSLARGMESLPVRLAEHLRGRGVTFVTARATGLERRDDGHWAVTIAPGDRADAVHRPSSQTTGPSPLEPLSAAAVVIALSAPGAAGLLTPIDPGAAADLAAIDYAGSAIVSLGFAREQVGHPLDAAGLVVPREAERRALAVSFSSSKFPGRAPQGCVLVRVFLGGALDPGVMTGDDEHLVGIARDEVAILIGARGLPRLVQVDRWAGAMPQYHVGHVERMRRVEQAVAAQHGLALAGNAYWGVGIPQVIASGRAAVDRCSR